MLLFGGLALAIVLTVVGIGIDEVAGKPGGLRRFRWGRMFFRLWAIFALIWMGTASFVSYPMITKRVQPAIYFDFDKGRVSDTSTIEVLRRGSSGAWEPVPQRPSVSVMARRTISYGGAASVVPTAVLLIGLLIRWALLRFGTRNAPTPPSPMI